MMDRKLIIAGVIIANIYIGYKAFLFYLVGIVFVFFPRSSNEYEGIQSLIWMLPLGLIILLVITLLIVGVNYFCYHFCKSKMNIAPLYYSLLSIFCVIIGNAVAFILRVL